MRNITTIKRAAARPSDVGVAAPAGKTLATDGPRGWMMVFAAFLSLYTVFGVAYSFGGFFGPMADEFGSERGATAFFFAVTTFLYFSLGVFSGKIADRIGPRPVMLFGAVCMSLGLFATSKVNSLQLGYVTYGLGVGIGVACGYVPVVAAVGGWFEKGRTTAIGIAVAGIGVGTLVNAPIVERLIVRYGWRQTYVIMAVASGALLTLAAFLAQRPPSMTTAAPPQLLTVIRSSKPFWILYASMSILSFPLFMPFVFMGDYLKVHGSSGSAGLLLGVIGLASVVGRLGLGTLAGRIPVVRLYQGSILALSISFLIWIAADDSYPPLLVFAVAMGVSYGGFIALAPAVAAELFGPAGLGGILGALYTSAGVGGLVGPPTMGFLIDRVDYTATLVIAMALAFVSFALLLPLAGTSKQDRLANTPAPVLAKT
ncbi:MAG: MFS family permease [Acidimicrobiales bacterium]|jgi:MFS family permease